MRLLFISMSLLLCLAGCSKQEPAAAPEPPTPEPGTAEAPPEPEPEPEPAKPEAAPDVMRTVAAADLPWQDVPNAPGVQMAMMFSHPETKSSAFFMKAPPNWSHGKHFHTANFHRVVVEGAMEVTMADGSKIASKKGDYVHGAANAIHSSASKDGVTIFIVTEGEFGTIDVNDDGQPKNAGDPAPGEAAGETRLVKAEDLKWQDVPGADAVKVAPVAKNEETQSVATFVKFGANFKSGDHTHSSSFHRVTLDGELAVGPKGGESVNGEAGSYFRGIGGLIHTGDSEAGGTIFLVSDGEWGTTFVDADGKPLPAPTAK